MRTRRRPLPFVPVTSHSPERDAELLSRLDDDGADARDRRLMVGPTFDELTEYVTVPAWPAHPFEEGA